MKTTKLALCAMLLGLAGAAEAATITVNFAVAPGNWFGDVQPYGLTDPTLSGSVDLDTLDSSGNSFKSLTYVTGTRAWGLADIDLNASSVFFDGNGDFQQFGLVFFGINYVYTNNTVSIAEDNGGNLACNFCVSITSVTGAGSVPEPSAWALLITGFGLTGAILRRRRIDTAAA